MSLLFNSTSIYFFNYNYSVSISSVTVVSISTSPSTLNRLRCSHLHSIFQSELRRTGCSNLENCNRSCSTLKSHYASAWLDLPRLASVHKGAYYIARQANNSTYTNHSPFSGNSLLPPPSLLIGVG